MSILTIILYEILSVFKNLADYTVEDSTAYPQVFYGGKV